MDGYYIEIKFYKNDELIATEFMVATDLEKMIEQFKVEDFDKIVVIGNRIKQDLENEECFSLNDSMESLWIDTEDDISM